MDQRAPRRFQRKHIGFLATWTLPYRKCPHKNRVSKRGRRMNVFPGVQNRRKTSAAGRLHGRHGDASALALPLCRADRAGWTPLPLRVAGRSLPPTPRALASLRPRDARSLAFALRVRLARRATRLRERANKNLRHPRMLQIQILVTT